MEDFAVRHIEQYGVVGKIVRDQKLVVPADGKEGEASGIRDGRSCGGFLQSDCDFLSWNERLRCDGDEAVGSNFAVDEFVDGDAVAGVTRLLACRVSN